MEEERVAYRCWRVNLKEIDHWADPGVDGKIIVRLILNK
jgi:hypothetical protein